MHGDLGQAGATASAVARVQRFHGGVKTGSVAPSSSATRRRPASTSARCSAYDRAVAELAAATRPLVGRESGDVLHTGADIVRAARDLGYAPATGLEDGLRAELDWVSTAAGTSDGRLRLLFESRG